MGRRFRKQPAYYSVFAVRDGTVWHAMSERKPGGMAPCDIDEDGVFRTFVDRLGEETRYTDVAKVVRGATLATCLNVKRVLRQRVAGELRTISQQISELKAQADRIEGVLERLVPSKDTPAKARQPQPGEASAK